MTQETNPNGRNTTISDISYRSEDIAPLQRPQGVANAVRLTMTAQVEGEDAVTSLHEALSLAQQAAISTLLWVSARSIAVSTVDEDHGSVAVGWLHPPAAKGQFIFGALKFHRFVGESEGTRGCARRIALRAG